MASFQHRPWTVKQDILLIQVVLATNAHREISRTKRIKSYATNLSCNKMPAILSTFSSQAAKAKLEPRTAASLKKRFGVLLRKYLNPSSGPSDCVITNEMKRFMDQVMEDRRKAWNLPPLRRILSLPSEESENIVPQEQNLLHRTSTCADETQGNLRAQGKKATPSGLRPCESGTLNVNANSQGFSGWGEPERTEDRAVPYKKRAFENRYMAESEVCNPYNNQPVERQQWDSRNVRVLKGRARGPPSEKDESAAPARSKNDGSMRPRTENFVETFRISEEASLKNWSAVQNMGHPLQRIAMEREDELVKMYNQVEELIFQLNADHQLKMLEMKQNYEREEHELDQELEALQRKLRIRQFKNMLEIRRRKQMYEIEELEYYKELGRMGTSRE